MSRKIPVIDTEHGALPLIIVFCGRAGSGKSTASSLFESTHQKFSIAEPIKKMMAAILDRSDSSDKTKSLEVLCGRTLRYGLQTLGQEWGKDLISKDIWLNILFKKIDAFLSKFSTQPLGVVVDDIRDDNEALAFRKRGALVIEIKRKGVKKMKHKSEAGISKEYIDIIVKNNDSPEKLKDKIIKKINNHALFLREIEKQKQKKKND